MIDPNSLNQAQQRDAMIIGLQVIAACQYMSINTNVGMGTFAIDGMNPRDGVTAFAVLITNKPHVVQAVREDQTDAMAGRGAESVQDTRLWQLVADMLDLKHDDLDAADAAEPPLVAGGQGRADGDVVISKQGLLAVIGLLGAIVVSGAVYAAVYWLVQ